MMVSARTQRMRQLNLFGSRGEPAAIASGKINRRKAWMMNDENHPSAVLTDRDVENIRTVVPALREAGWSWSKLAEKFDTPARTLRDIVSYRRRK